MGRHELLLNLSTDGRITDGERRAARAQDEAERAGAPRTPARVTPGAIVLKPEEIIRRMARVIATEAPKRGTVHVKDFERAGITKPQADRHLAAAMNRARTIDPAIDNLETAA